MNICNVSRNETRLPNTLTLIFSIAMLLVDIKIKNNI